MGHVLRDLDLARRQRVYLVHCLQDRGLVGGGVEAAPGLLHGQLPGDVRQDVAEPLVVGGPDEVDGNGVVRRLLQDVVERLPLVDGVGVLPVAEHHHQVALRPQEVEGAEELHAAADRAHDQGAVVGKAVVLLGGADEADAQQHVLVVVGERGDDVRLAPELNQRDEVAVRPLHAPPHEVLGGGGVGEERVAPAELVGGERAVHAERGVDEDGDAVSRVRRALLDQGGVGVGEGDREERQAGQDQRERRVAERREGRAPGDGGGEQRRQDEVGATGPGADHGAGEQRGQREEGQHPQRDHRLVAPRQGQGGQGHPAQLRQCEPKALDDRGYRLHGASSTSRVHQPVARVPAADERRCDCDVRR